MQVATGFYSQTKEPPGRAVEKTAANSRRVLIFDLEGDPSLTKVLDQLQFVGERGKTRSIDPADLQDIVAVIVSDAVDLPLDLCTMLSANCPVILVSDEKSFALRQAAAESGISALVRRPVSPVELSEWLEHFSHLQSSEPISVMIVDDDWLTSELNAEVLRSSGMMVKTVTDPTEALQVIEETLPDLILMDMQMPGVDGVQLVQIIRQSRQLISLPIIFLSAEQDEDRQLMARRLGGDDFVCKPVDPKKLISLVRLRADRSRSLRSMIERDRLTGLYNHSRFSERLSQELERCRRTAAQICLVMIDIDEFKQVNDRYGHPAGDTVLRSLASSLTGSLRQIDVVGRYGGEEFGVILLDTDPKSAKVVVDRLRQRFMLLPFGAGSGQFSVSFSAGIASSHDFKTTIDLVAGADRALYQAKANGRNCVNLAQTRLREVPKSENAYRLDTRKAADCFVKARK